MDDRSFLDHLLLLFEDRSNDPLILPWPSPGTLGAVLSFQTVNEWRDFVLCLSLNNAIPEVVAAKFRRAQKLFFLGWMDIDLIKAGELVGLTALELALKDRYGNPHGSNKLANLLKYMVEKDGLTDEKIPMIQRYGGTVISRFTGESKPSLAEMRNSLAHGDPFDGLPWSGLLELIRDLIHYAYRDSKLSP